MGFPFRPPEAYKKVYITAPYNTFARKPPTSVVRMKGRNIRVFYNFIKTLNLISCQRYGMIIAK